MSSPPAPSARARPDSRRAPFARSRPRIRLMSLDESRAAWKRTIDDRRIECAVCMGLFLGARDDATWDPAEGIRVARASCRTHAVCSQCFAHIRNDVGRAECPAEDCAGTLHQSDFDRRAPPARAKRRLRHVESVRAAARAGTSVPCPTCAAPIAVRFDVMAHTKIVQCLRCGSHACTHCETSVHRSPPLHTYSDSAPIPMRADSQSTVADSPPPSWTSASASASASPLVLPGDGDASAMDVDGASARISVDSFFLDEGEGAGVEASCPCSHSPAWSRFWRESDVTPARPTAAAATAPSVAPARIAALRALDFDARRQLFAKNFEEMCSMDKSTTGALMFHPVCRGAGATTCGMRLHRTSMCSELRHRPSDGCGDVHDSVCAECGSRRLPWEVHGLPLEHWREGGGVCVRFPDLAGRDMPKAETSKLLKATQLMCAELGLARPATIEEAMSMSK